MIFNTIDLKYVAQLNASALSEDVDSDYEIKYVDIGSVSSLGRIEKTENFKFKDAPSRARRIVKDGDVIISTVRTYLQAIAPIEAPEENLIVSTGFAVVTPKRNLISLHFCKYTLRTKEFIDEVISRSVGINYPAINASDLACIKIPLPPLEIQTKIAIWLDKETRRIDALVDAKQTLLTLLAEKRRALISHSVTKGLNPKVKMKDSGIPWLGEIPEHWRVERVLWNFRERDERSCPELPLMEVSIHHGVRVRELADDKINQKAEDFNSYKVARKDDISFNKMRMWQGAVGTVPCDGLVSPDYVVAEPIGEMSSDYYGILFKTPRFSDEAGARSHGIVWDRLRLYWEEFKDISIPVPPLKEQTAIVNFLQLELKKLTDLETATENSIALLQERRSALITAAVTGELEEAYL